ncbi:MAG: hypothetical protein Q8M11_06420 [Sulfuritalea sp.]|nr:hypothetical protein [Sulfuritalea sp.]MDP1982129.1 hypothetical protein [Sulfuritalea sp.]
MDDPSQPSPLLEALRRIAENPNSYGHGLDEAGDEFHAALVEGVHRKGALGKERLQEIRQVGRSVLGILRPPKSDQEALTRLKANLNLTDRQLRAIRAIRILLEDRASGGLRLKDKSAYALSPERAGIYLFAIGCLSGAALSLLVTSSEPLLVAAIRGLGYSIALGSIAGFVLERSYRLYPVLQKLETAELWITGPQTTRISLGL